MNILILADLVTFSGVGNYIRYLTTTLVERGNKVVIVTAQDDLHIEGVKTFLLRPINISPINIFFNIRVLKNIIEEHSIDIIHANHRMSSFLVGVYNLFYSHIPSVWTAHTGRFPMSFFKKIFGYYGDRSIAISFECKTFMRNVLSISEKKIDVVNNGIKPNNLLPLSKDEIIKLKNIWNIPDDKLVIAIHGRIAYEKGLDFLVESLKYLDTYSLSKIVIVCSGIYENNNYYDYLKDLIIKNKFQNLFIFVGWCETRNLLGISDLFLNLSRREGFLIAAIEAFFMEVPVIRTMEGGFEDMKDICVGIPFGDKDALLYQIKSFIDNPLQFSDMIQKAKAKALEQFTLDTMVSKTYDVYLSAIKSVNKKQFVS